MYARTTTVHGDPTAIDEGIAFLRDRVMPAVEGLPGYVGLSLLADRHTGRCIATTSWKDEAAMAGTGEQLRPLRTRFAEVLGGSVELHSWKIAVVHRVHEAPDGACTRVTWTRTDPNRMAQALDAYRTGLLPRLEELDGFCSASFMVNRETGRAVGTVTFESRAHVEASRDAATSIRANATSELGAAIDEVAELEVALAHLHVPEMA